MGDSRELTVRHFSPQSREWVWQRLLSREFMLGGWVLDINMPTVAVGHHFTFRTFPIPGTVFTGTVRGEFTDVKYNEYLTFNLTTLGPAPPWHSQAAWFLESTGQGTHLVYCHWGFDPTQPRQMFLRSVIVRAIEAALLRFDDFDERSSHGPWPNF